MVAQVMLKSEEHCAYTFHFQSKRELLEHPVMLWILSGLLQLAGSTGQVVEQGGATLS